MNYEEFLRSKTKTIEAAGFEIAEDRLNPKLFPFQRRLVRWALHRGRAAVFADCGLGKTPIQLEWAERVCAYTCGSVLIVAPLAVSEQTVREGVKFGIRVRAARSQADVDLPGIYITNYEMLHHFDPAAFRGMVLDESSILKAFGGVYRQQITEFASSIPFRLACTATPAPNDLIEITNHAEFLGIMSGKEIIALYFVQDGNTTHAWRLKGHAKTDFWKWLATWAVALRNPEDLGYPMDGFVLPELIVHEHVVEIEKPCDGYLFAMEAITLEERRRARSSSTEERAAMVAEIIATKPDEPWLVWCDLNAEGEAARRLIPGAIEIRGSDTPEEKRDRMIGFSNGDVRVMVTKPSIAGWGMNWQHCANMVFLGLSDSWESYYQAVRRCWRFGQTRHVNVHLVISEQEGAVRSNIERKEAQAKEMMDRLVEHMKDLQLDRCVREEMTYKRAVERGSGWEMHLGDSVEVIDEIEAESVGLILFSPPFPGMYAYTNSTRDVGNCETIDQMIGHFRHMVGRDKLMRTLKPGRKCAIHLTQLTAMKSRDGYIGVKDYRGRVISMMEEEGWIYFGEVTIDKNPQIQATRNKERGLLFKTLATDSSLTRMALADYLIYFMKPGDNPEPIPAGISKKYNPGGGWVSEEEWIEAAAPVWYRKIAGLPGGIRETDVLNVRTAKESDDERHLCPLQLGVIDRAVKLWTNPGDIVLSPFGGIGSEGYQALLLGRRYVGIELKESYWRTACDNLRIAAASGEQDLFANEPIQIEA